MLRRLTAEERDRALAAFLHSAQEAWARMFDPAHQGDLQTFDQRDEAALEVAQTLGAQLLAQHLHADELTDAAWPAQVACPWCEQPAPAVTPAGTAPARELRAQVGAVAYPRPEYHCRPCRRSFFPGGPRVRARDRRL